MLVVALSARSQKLVDPDIYGDPGTAETMGYVFLWL